VGLGLGAVSGLGCGGSAPLLHPAHTLFPGDVSVGAGLSAEVALNPRQAVSASGSAASPEAERAASLQDLTVPLSVGPNRASTPPGSPASGPAGLISAAAGSSAYQSASITSIAPQPAPWVGARVGIRGSNEAGITYAGRSIRIDGRHAWSLGSPTLSVGLGATALLPERPDHDDAVGSVFGGGVDVPVLIGLKSKNDLYAGWLGVRGGFETLKGDIAGLPSAGGASSAPITEEVSAQHYYVGLVLGLRAGFRHLHVALEVQGALHRAVGTIGGDDIAQSVITLTPGGAVIISF
jgi:hypothetical protein